MRGNWGGLHYFTLLKQWSQQEYLCLRIPERLEMGRTDTSLTWSFWIELKTVFKEHNTPKSPPFPLRQGDWPCLLCRRQFYSLERWVRICRLEVWSWGWGPSLKTGGGWNPALLTNRCPQAPFLTTLPGLWLPGLYCPLLPAKQEAPPQGKHLQSLTFGGPPVKWLGLLQWDLPIRHPGPHIHGASNNLVSTSFLNVSGQT